MQLLAAIREIFEQRKVDALRSAVLVDDLTQDPEGLWAEYGRRGEPITAKQVASSLEPYRVKPDVVRDGTRTYRGYKRECFKDAFERYLPSEGLSKCNTRNSVVFKGIFAKFTRNRAPSMLRMKMAKSLAISIVLQCYGLSAPSDG